MLKEAREIADKYGDTGVYRIRTALIYYGGCCVGTVWAHVFTFLHWLKGDLDDRLENLNTEINKRG